MARRSQSPRRRNPAASLLHTFVSGVTANLGTAVGTAFETLVISAGAIAVDRLLAKSGTVRLPPGAPTNPTTSPAALETFLRHSEARGLLSSATVIQFGTIPGTKTHEVVFGLQDGTRLAARCTETGQITLKQLSATPAPVTVTADPDPKPTATPTPRPTVDDFGIIDCTQTAAGEWEPVG